jgi:hypothetical protein
MGAADDRSVIYKSVGMIVWWSWAATVLVENIPRAGSLTMLLGQDSRQVFRLSRFSRHEGHAGAYTA